MNSEFKSIRGDLSLPPNAEQLINALRQIGYSFEQAIADLVDNCVNAKAKNVLIRFVYDAKAITQILVVDDGHGMTGAILSKAMRFGAHEDSGDLSLGKFGMGMKLASFSHAKTLSVCTMSGGISSGRRWTVEGIAKNWTCSEIPKEEVRTVLDAGYLGIDLSRCGTVIQWGRIDRLSASKNGVEATISQLMGRLKVHLGLHFHRFLETKKLSIKLDSLGVDEDEPDDASSIAALNPFGYPESGSSDYPQSFAVSVPEIGRINATAHIWPPNNKSQQYSLGNRAAARQGFYFYRNDRLIQAGGWNGVVESETEPHTSLARVAIDLPAAMDEHFGLNVQKSLVIVPPSFVDSIQQAKSGNGTTFPKYRAQAALVYRKKDDRAKRDYPFTPDGSLASDLTRKAKEILAGNGKARPVTICWAELDDPDALFEIDRDKLVLRIDKRIRKRLLGGRRASGVDLPVFKILMFLLVAEDFDKAWHSAKRRERLDEISKLILAALRHEGDS